VAWWAAMDGKPVGRASASYVEESNDRDKTVIEFAVGEIKPHL